jgi:alkaline phosphatase
MRMGKRMAAGAVMSVAAVTAVTGITVAAGTDDDNSKAVKQQIQGKKPKNVIYLLGDGMGDSEITSARYYGKGAKGRLNMDSLPFTGEATTWSVKPGSGPSYTPDYVPDSASTGTAWSTGKKTIDERISQGPSAAVTTPGQNYRTVLEAAQKAGKRTGDVSTAELTDATPAVLASHVSQRACQGPADTRTTCPKETKAAGGLGSIAEQEVDHEVDVLLGGGLARFQQPLKAGGDRTVVDRAREDGYRTVTNASGLNGLQNLKGGPVLGLFNASNMTQEFKPLVATAGAGSGSATTRCQEGNRPASEPSLSAMTTKALDLLESKGSDGKARNGFFLQVEGASIDKRDHAADICGQIGETLAFDRAIGVALDYQRSHPDTLVIVTADHAHTSQIVPEESKPLGLSGTVQTKDGAPLRLSYGTAPAGGSQEHTGSEVRIGAKGPQATNVLGITDETDTFHTLMGR